MDLSEKIENHLQQNPLTESDVRSLMILVRKKLDDLERSGTGKNDYSILNLFCNWSAHIDITSSITGFRILERVNRTFVAIKNSTDMGQIASTLSAAIGFKEFCTELKSFAALIQINEPSGAVLKPLVAHLFEIIRDVPIEFPDLSKLKPKEIKIYKAIEENPIKEGAGVIAIQLSLVNYDVILPNRGIGTIPCLLIRTKDTTTTVVPFSLEIQF